MEAAEVYLNALDEAWGTVLKATDGLTRDDLAKRPTDQANSIGWLLWHMARVEDALVVGRLMGQAQMWVQRKWHERFGMAEDSGATGGRQTAEEAAALSIPDRDTLLGYATAVRDATRSYLRSVNAADLDEQVDWFRGGTAPKARFLDLLIKETHQHAGQMAYVRGLLRGMEGIF
ncbi:MAG: DinB family protein [Dehalococcoidia bacterium]